jgi:hypothetical protein
MAVQSGKGGHNMQQPDFWSRMGVFARCERGSVGVATALFAIALAAVAAMGVLDATGLLQVPQLIHLILLVSAGFAGWDLLRERRKAGGRDADRR